MTLLLVGAFEPEIRPFVGLLPPDVHTRAIGIGLVDAALGAAAAITATQARAVVFVGTCGAFAGSGLAIGDVVVLRDTVLADSAAAAGHAHLLPSLASPLAGDVALGRALAPAARPVRVVTVLGITTDDATAASLASSSGGEVEHLEAFAVARAAALANVPFTAVLGVANAVGARGRAEWVENHVAASEAVLDSMRHSVTEGTFRHLLASPHASTL